MEEQKFIYLVQVIKMAAVAIYSKNLKKKSSSKSTGQLSRNLVCSILDSSTTKYR